MKECVLLERIKAKLRIITLLMAKKTESRFCGLRFVPGNREKAGEID